MNTFIIITFDSIDIRIESWGGGVNRHSNLRILIENVRILKYEQNGGIITKRGTTYNPCVGDLVFKIFPY